MNKDAQMGRMKMENVKYSQTARITVPRYELYVPEGKFPNEVFSLEDAKRVLGRWGIREPTDNCWGDPWTYEMTEIYRQIRERDHLKDRHKAELVNKVIAGHVQNQFSKAIMQSMGDDFDLIATVHVPACATYFMRDCNSKGVVSLQEPYAQNMVERNPNLGFELKSTEEIDLGRLVEKVNDGLSKMWDLPR